MADKKVNIRKAKMSADAGISPEAKALGHSRTDDGAQPKNTPAASENAEKLRALAMFCAEELEKALPRTRAVRLTTAAIRGGFSLWRGSARSVPTRG